MVDERFTVVGRGGRKSGFFARSIAGNDISYVFHVLQNGRGPHVEGKLKLASDGTTASLSATGHHEMGTKIAETFSRKGDQVTWKSEEEQGDRKAPSSPAFFVPMADLIGRLKLGNTLSAVMLTYPTLLVPFIAWLLMGYFKTVPKELEEQALIDGASRWRAMTRVILPLCMPGFISAGIFAFTLAQNEFLYALLFLSRSDVRTVPIGVVGELIRGDAFYWGQLMAGALLGSVPVALIYSFFVKYYVAGLTAGAVKG